MKTSIEIEYKPQSSVLIDSNEPFAVEVVTQSPISVELSLTNIGPKGDSGEKGDKGDKGDPGDTTSINGYPVSISNPSPYDVISFVAGSFVNKPQADITDGGNY